MLRAKRDVKPPKAFFSKAIKHQVRPPKTITLDGYAASHRAVREMKVDGLFPEDTAIRSSKYLNNLIEQDHRNVKPRTNVILGFKRFGNAANTISGIESIRYPIYRSKIIPTDYLHQSRNQTVHLTTLAAD
jgi:transposase-like protein